MTTEHRRNAMRPLVALLFVASVAATIVFAATPAGAQGGIQILGSGGSDELEPPPSPTCADRVFITEVTFDAAGNPIDIPRFGSSADLTQVYDVPDFKALGPGILRIDEVIVYDGHIGRAIWTPQLEEQVYFEFLLDGVSQLRTPLTPDVPDGQRTGWHDVDMGSYELPNGADTLRIHHGGGVPADVNSLVVSALCGRLEPFPEVIATTIVPTTEPPATTEVPATTVSPTTEVATTAPASTVAPTTTESIDTEVGGQVELPAPELAVTGRTQSLSVIFALLSIALGALLVRLSSQERTA